MKISNLKKKLEFETRLTRFGRVVFALYSAFATCLVSILFLRFVLLHRFEFGFVILAFGYIGTLKFVIPLQIIESEANAVGIIRAVRILLLIAIVFGSAAFLVVNYPQQVDSVAFAFWALVIISSAWLFVLGNRNLVSEQN